METVTTTAKAALKMDFLLKLLLALLALFAGMELLAMFWAPASTLIVRPIATIKILFGSKAA